MDRIEISCGAHEETDIDIVIVIVLVPYAHHLLPDRDYLLAHRQEFDHRIPVADLIVNAPVDVSCHVEENVFVFA